MDYDVIVIGGGPAGMMAAGTAAERGASVLLIEKNPRPGRKLLLSGGGRCNLANMELDVNTLAGRFHNGRFLYPAFTALGPKETAEFFRRIGLPTVEEPGGRVFPATGRAFDVLRALEDWMRGLRVKVMNRAVVLGLKTGKGEVAGVRLSNGTLTAGSYILCTGGKSYPGTGSTGDGYGFARSLGHTIKPLVPALVPLTVTEDWLNEAEGASIPDAGLAIMAGGKKRGAYRGELVFTRRGISGPAALNASGTVCGLAAREEVTLSVDLYPAMTYAELDDTLMEYISANQNRRMKNCLAGFVPPKLTPVVLSIAGVDGSMQGNRLSKKMRQTLAKTIKGLKMTVRGPGGFEKAMVTRGGVDTDEVDPKTMRSRLLANLFFAGEVLDIDGESGGYNLQACWSTGYLAGKNS